MENIQMRIGKGRIPKYIQIKTFLKPPTIKPTEAERWTNVLHNADANVLEDVLTRLWPEEDSRRKENFSVRLAHFLSLIISFNSLIKSIAESTTPGSPTRQEAELLYQEGKMLLDSVLKNIIIGCGRSGSLSEVILSIRKLTDTLKELDKETLIRFSKKDLEKRKQNVVSIRISLIMCDENGIKIDLPRELGKLFMGIDKLAPAVGLKTRGLKTKLFEIAIFSFLDAELPEEDNPETFILKFFKNVEEQSEKYAKALINE